VDEDSTGKNMKTNLAVQVGFGLFVGVLSLHAQSTPSSQSLCSMPGQQGTAMYNKYCGSGTAATTSPSAPATLNPALGDATKSVGNALGQQLGKAVFGDPAAKAANAAAAQQANLAANSLAAHQLNDSGIYLLKNGNYNGAINEFQQALAIAPNDASILYNLSLAKQKLKDAAAGANNSSAFAPFLGNSPANPGNSNSDSVAHSSGANLNASAISLVNLDSSVVDFRKVRLQVHPPATLPNSDSNVVNLSGTTSTSPASLKSQLDAAFGNSTPGSAPAALVSPNDQAQQNRAQMDAIFEKQSPTPDPDAIMKALFDLNHKP
jgi:tetratricopeptide (TPR) repeat protein